MASSIPSGYQLVPIVSEEKKDDSSNSGETGAALDKRKNRQDHIVHSSIKSDESLVFELDYGEMMKLLDASIEEFEYSGFLPVPFRAFLYTFFLKVKSLSKAQVTELITWSLMIVAQRGTKVAVDSKVKTEAKGKLNQLVAAGVTLNPKSGAPANTVITLQRISAVHPKEMSVVMSTGATRIIGDRPAGLPRFFCHAQSLAILPRNKEGSAIHEMIKSWKRSFSDTIRSHVAVTNKTDFDALIFRSELVPDSERMKTVAHCYRTELSQCPKDSNLILGVMEKEFPTLANAIKIKEGFTTGVADASMAGLSQASIDILTGFASRRANAASSSSL